MHRPAAGPGELLLAAELTIHTTDGWMEGEEPYYPAGRAVCAGSAAFKAPAILMALVTSL